MRQPDTTLKVEARGIELARLMTLVRCDLHQQLAVAFPSNTPADNPSDIPFPGLSLPTCNQPRHMPRREQAKRRGLVTRGRECENQSIDLVGGEGTGGAAAKFVRNV